MYAVAEYDGRATLCYVLLCVLDLIFHRQHIRSYLALTVSPFAEANFGHNRDLRPALSNVGGLDLDMCR